MKHETCLSLLCVLLAFFLYLLLRHNHTILLYTVIQQHWLGVYHRSSQDGIKGMEGITRRRTGNMGRDGTTRQGQVRDGEIGVHRTVEGTRPPEADGQRSDCAETSDVGLLSLFQIQTCVREKPTQGAQECRNFQDPCADVEGRKCGGETRIHR